MEKCPCCDAELEDKQHILHCPAIGARQQWKTSVDKLQKWLREQGMEPGLQDTILAELKAWSQAQEPQPRNHSVPLEEKQN